MDPLKNMVEIGVPSVQKHFDSGNLLLLLLILPAVANELLLTPPRQFLLRKSVARRMVSSPCSSSKIR